MAKYKRPERKTVQHDDAGKWRDVNGRNAKNEDGSYKFTAAELQQMIDMAKASPKADSDPDGIRAHIADLQAALVARGE